MLRLHRKKTLWPKKHFQRKIKAWWWNKSTKKHLVWGLYVWIAYNIGWIASEFTLRFTVLKLSISENGPCGSHRYPTDTNKFRFIQISGRFELRRPTYDKLQNVHKLENKPQWSRYFCVVTLYQCTFVWNLKALWLNPTSRIGEYRKKTNDYYFKKSISKWRSNSFACTRDICAHMCKT